MVHRNTNSKCTGRAGFTLLELMLVLALLVLLGALATPRISEVFERQKLNGSATELRLLFDEARLEAMRTGQAQVFQCVVGASGYSIKPLVLQSDISNAGAGATVMTGAGTLVETQGNGLMTAADPQEMTESEELEEGISFASCLVAGDYRAYATAQEAQASGSTEVNTQSINSQVIFYPDGSTSTAEVQIKNERGDIRAVRIRGLTGYSKIVAIKDVGTKDSAKEDES